MRIRLEWIVACVVGIVIALPLVASAFGLERLHDISFKVMGFLVVGGVIVAIVFRPSIPKPHDQVDKKNRKEGE